MLVTLLLGSPSSDCQTCRAHLESVDTARAHGALISNASAAQQQRKSQPAGVIGTSLISFASAFKTQRTSCGGAAITAEQVQARKIDDLDRGLHYKPIAQTS